jgi:hypothetical protein
LLIQPVAPVRTGATGLSRFTPQVTRLLRARWAMAFDAGAVGLARTHVRWRHGSLRQDLIQRYEEALSHRLLSSLIWTKPGNSRFFDTPESPPLLHLSITSERRCVTPLLNLLSCSKSRSGERRNACIKVDLDHTWMRSAHPVYRSISGLLRGSRVRQLQHRAVRADLRKTVVSAIDAKIGDVQPSSAQN